MPDTQQDSAPQPSPDIASLTGGGPPSDSSAIADLTKLKRQQIGEESKVIDKTNANIDRDQARMERAFKAEGIEPETLKPWNANKEHEKFESDPIQGIGSVGGLFAVIASAFTKAPATNAIEGMAGAINAIKEGNEAAYNRAFESYKQNTKLALDRQKIQHEQYQDATSLMATNMAAGQAKMQNLAAKFGDQNTLMLIEHGMNKELFEMQDARMKSAEQWMQYNENLDKHQFQKLAIDEIKKNPPNTGNPVADKMQMAAQIQRVYDGSGKYGTAEQEAVGKYVMAHQNDPPDKFADGLAEVHQQFSPKAANIEGYQNAKSNWQDQHPGETMSADEDAKLLTQFGLTGRPTGAGGSQSSQANKTKAIEEIMERHKAEGKPIERAEAEREYKQTIQIPTAHDQYQADAQYQKAERMEGAMNEMDELLVKHKFMTGIGGTLTRPIEAIGNVLGSNETDRKQFQRVATELKEWGQSVLNDRSGRPLSSEAHDAAVIFAGLNPGDTSANTVRAIVELRPVIKQIKEQIKARGQGKGPVTGGAESAPSRAEEPKGKDAPWMNDPVKGGDGKRSDADPVRSGAQYAQADVSSDVHTITSGPEYNKWDEALQEYGSIRIPKDLDEPQKWLNQGFLKKYLEQNGIDREDKPDGSVILRKKAMTS